VRLRSERVPIVVRSHIVHRRTGVAGRQGVRATPVADRSRPHTRSLNTSIPFRSPHPCGACRNSPFRAAAIASPTSFVRVRFDGWRATISSDARPRQRAPLGRISCLSVQPWTAEGSQ
jgi:hypothetical protein